MAHSTGVIESERRGQLLELQDEAAHHQCVATRHILQSSIPLIHQVIPFMDLLTSSLEQSLDDTSLHPAVHTGVSRGLALLNKYYEKTDQSIMYRMAMSK